jgi:hypothetical protein
MFPLTDTWRCSIRLIELILDQMNLCFFLTRVTFCFIRTLFFSFERNPYVSKFLSFYIAFNLCLFIITHTGFAVYNLRVILIVVFRTLSLF